MPQPLRAFPVAIIFSFLFSCQSEKNITQQNDDELQKHAQELAQRFIITDGHVDLPYRLRVKKFRLLREYLEIPIKSNEGDFDYERAKKGGLDAPFNHSQIERRVITYYDR